MMLQNQKGSTGNWGKMSGLEGRMGSADCWKPVDLELIYIYIYIDSQEKHIH